MLAIRLGGRPADAEHPYGHRRAENLAALILETAASSWTRPRLEDDVRARRPGIADVVVHTEP